MVDPVAPRRDQLEAIAKGDHRLLIALERLFEVAGSITPTDLDRLQQQAQGAAASMASMRALLSDVLIVSTAALAAAHRKRPQDLSEIQDAIAVGYARNRQSGHLARLQDVSAPFPANGDLLSWDETIAKWVPVSGATGSFTTADLKTVTVTNGIISSIV